jgi:GYD domain
MPLYLTRFSYTPETWARLIDTPEDRRNAAQSYIESVGGKLHGFWYAFGTRRLQPLGGSRQRVHGRGCGGDHRGRCP